MLKHWESASIKNHNDKISGENEGCAGNGIKSHLYDIMTKYIRPDIFWKTNASGSVCAAEILRQQGIQATKQIMLAASKCYT